MVQYRITIDEQFSEKIIDQRLFGTNFVTIYDYEFGENPQLLDLLGELGASTLRYPGGSVTEYDFTDASFITGDWSADSHLDKRGDQQTLLPLGEFFASAGAVGAGAQLVIPTRIAFEQSAGQAMAQGVYGERTEIDSRYFEYLTRFIDKSILESEKYDVKIERLEIGNEFWGSGFMTATEYGFIAAKITTFLSTKYPNIDIVAQVTAGANRYSPYFETAVLLEPTDDGDFIVHLESEYKAEPPQNWIKSTMPGMGSGANQTKLIAEEFLKQGDVANHLSGIVDHVYFDAGFDGIDTQRNFALDYIPKVFADVVGLEDIDYYITEWSARNPRAGGRTSNLGNANGLEYAQSTVEAFFELASNGIDGANFWPTTFGTPSVKYRTLIDTQNERLTFGGISFQWLSESALNTKALFDYESVDGISIHGFGNEHKLTIFLAERSGESVAGISLDAIEIDVTEFLGADQYFVMTSSLNSQDGVSDSDSSTPEVSMNHGTMMDAGILSVSVKSWDLTRIELQAVTELHDELSGGPTNDTIAGRGGDDLIKGNDGHDLLKGEMGNDTLLGGAGDDILKGGWGNDLLNGGDGGDRLYGGQNNDQIFGSYGDDFIWGNEGDDYLEGGEGSDAIYGDDGNDTIVTGSGNDYAVGGNGDDLFLLEEVQLNSSVYTLWNTNYSGTYGTNEWKFIRNATEHEFVIEGGDGVDTIRMGDERDILYLHDSYVGYHEDVALRPDVSGRLSAARFSEVELIEGMGGDDIILLDSPNYSSKNPNIIVDGGDGDDIIWGSAESETLIGGAGDDEIFGRAGVDVFVGGSGSDTFKFSASSKSVTIDDFDILEGDQIFLYGNSESQFSISSAQVNANTFSIDLVNSNGVMVDRLDIIFGKNTELEELSSTALTEYVSTF
tara:strand:- start:5944 stop:8637 length:2694 start_codon:yes stop_codon:yes gene_type:complete